ncbi:MAG: DUF4965 domain-containing protein [Candidatus Hydrogenedentes bacterium]|nr:DUF4965 domain-containing protein [Candidatus Hydrogenedentota bacterium]
MTQHTLPIVLSLLTAGAGAPSADLQPFRPPAVPLVTLDPYTSVWSPADALYDAWPAHWTGAVKAMTGILRVDGVAYRFMGATNECSATATQSGVSVRPTQTEYAFQAGGVELRVTFTTPMLPDDLALLSSPVTFLDFEARAADGGSHEVQLYFDATAEWVVNKAEQEVAWERAAGPQGVALFRFGSKDQPILEKDGDRICIDWGYFYVALPEAGGAAGVVAGADDARKTFCAGGAIPAKDDTRQPRPAKDDWPVIACAFPLGSVGATPVQRQLTLAYDDVYSIEYMHQRLRPWWFAHYGRFNAMLDACLGARADIAARCRALDDELTADARRAGGEQYARLAALGYRHTFASGKIVQGPDGTPWFFHKECASNGCTGTVDVSYPASPFFALLCPALLKGMMEPVFDFAASGDWKWDFAPHDVGRYPKANGQVYRTESIEGQMPVEECGNMILMAAAAARAEGSAAFAAKHWELLTQWADYLKEKGLDPENQLCTDDFAGHLAHNANLSLKAINALGAYAMLCDMLDKKDDATAYAAAAREMAQQWQAMAAAGDHYRLTFDRPDTWSMKYNLVWDKILGLGLFPDTVADTEVAYYLTIQNRFGLPLDCRKDYTKSDWLVWSATLASSQSDFEALIAPLYRFCNETPDRVPFTDWYDTKTAEHIHFRARPVIGGIYIKLLEDGATWRKWAERGAR